MRYNRYRQGSRQKKRAHRQGQIDDVLAHIGNVQAFKMICGAPYNHDTLAMLISMLIINDDQHSKFPESKQIPTDTRYFPVKNHLRLHPNYLQHNERLHHKLQQRFRKTR